MIFGVNNMAKTGSHLKIENFGSNAMGVRLKGDIETPEYDLFLVKFKGGEVEITRTPDGDYWIHVIANLPNMADSSRNFGEPLGAITDSRAHVLPNSNGKISDIAVRISTKGKGLLSAESLENPEILLMQLKALSGDKEA
jgi:hypothetical protein